MTINKYNFTINMNGLYNSAYDIVKSEQNNLVLFCDEESPNLSTFGHMALDGRGVGFVEDVNNNIKLLTESYDRIPLLIEFPLLSDNGLIGITNTITQQTWWIENGERSDKGLYSNFFDYDESFLKVRDQTLDYISGLDDEFKAEIEYNRETFKGFLDTNSVLRHISQSEECIPIFCSVGKTKSQVKYFLDHIINLTCGMRLPQVL